jgi:hypothetical protein
MGSVELRLAAALVRGATPAHLAALCYVRDAGCMWADIDPRRVAEREDIKGALWSWRAVTRASRGKLRLTAIGSAILFVAAQEAWNDARSNQCA